MPTPASPYRTELPRPEHPRAQFVRPDWRSLNGEWEFEVDQGDSGLERGLRDRPLAGTIVVPFAPESKRSGVERTDFLEAVWYRRTITLPPIWAGKRVLLHFQAVDHDATVWVNGVEVARHRGGFTPFTADLAGVAGPGDQATIVVRARDTRHGTQARGKQATWFANSGPYYTRTTGIWQSVWVELVGAVAGIRCAGVRTATHSPRGGIPRVRGWMACASPPSEEASATETPERSHEL